MSLPSTPAEMQTRIADLFSELKALGAMCDETTSNAEYRRLSDRMNANEELIHLFEGILRRMEPRNPPTFAGQLEQADQAVIARAVFA